MMNQTLQRDKAACSPITIEWSGDSFLDAKGRDVLDPSFMDGNESVGSNEDMLNFPEPSKAYDTNQAVVHQVSKSSSKLDASISSESSSRKRSKSCQSVIRRKKKPKGMPKRPLSAYNLYFQSERAKIWAAADCGEGVKIGFEDLGKIIGKQWREINSADKKFYEKLAEKDSIRYRKEMDAYNELRTKKLDEEEQLSSVVDGFQQSTSSITDQASTTSKVQPYEPLISFHHPQSLEQNMYTAQPNHMTAPAYTSDDYARRQNPMLPVFPAAPEANRVQYQNYASEVQQHSPSQTPTPPTITHEVSFPPPPPGGEPVNYSGSFPMPPGMEIVLSDRNGKDRKYRVQYTCYSMTRDAAYKYMESITGAPGAPAPQPQPAPAPPPALLHPNPSPFPPSWGGGF